MKPKALFKKLIEGSLNNVQFNDMVKLIEGFGFKFVRQSGSHQIFSYPDIQETINLQEVKGEAKPYQT